MKLKLSKKKALLLADFLGQNSRQALADKWPLLSERKLRKYDRMLFEIYDDLAAYFERIAKKNNA
jgi:hypothetical protein